MRTRRSLLILLSTAVYTLACGRPPAAPAPDATCLWMPGDAAPGDTLRIAFTDLIDPAARSSDASDGWSFLVHNLYDTPIRLDCTNRPYAGLATSWTRETASEWTLTLAEGVRLWDGSAVNAEHLRRDWDGGVREGVRVLGPTRVAVTASSLEALSSIAYAVVGESGDPVPTGTGPYRPVTEGSTSSSNRWVLASSGPGRRPIVISVMPGADGRDIMDEGADILITRDRTIRTYAEAHPDFSVRALAWNRTYVLLTGVPPAAFGTSSKLGPAFAEELATRTVRAEARTGRSAGAVCDVASVPGRGSLAEFSDRVVYLRDDVTARAIAERLVGVSEARTLLPGDVPLRRVAGLSAREFGSALAEGGDGAYVVGVSGLIESCEDLEGGRIAFPEVFRSALPLIDTRPTIVARRIAQPLRIDAHGVVRVVAIDGEGPR